MEETLAGDEKGYNGWTNYPTWATALHIDNDQSTYEESRRIVRDNLSYYSEDDFGPTGKVKTHPIKEALKEWTCEVFGIDDLDNGLAAELLGAAWDSINWYEIAGNLIDEVLEEDKEVAE